MPVLVTGSSGHLGEALVRVLTSEGHEVVGLDLIASPTTEVVASITERSAIKACMAEVDAVIHTATLHKPHIDTHGRQAFVDTNVTGTLILLEEAAEADVRFFVLTSTTSLFGRALTPPPGRPAAWIDEDVFPEPKNIYGVTKRAAEDLAQLFYVAEGLPCIVLRTSRFFPELDDDPSLRNEYEDANIKVNELLYRRVEIEDAVSAHLLALDRASTIGFGRYVISATTPFARDDLERLRNDAPSVVRRMFRQYEAIYASLGWKMFPNIDRVYINERARAELGWSPRYDFKRALECLKVGEEFRSPLALAIGTKGYNATTEYPSTEP